VGDYTLTVTFTKEVFRDGAWVSDGTTDTKSVSFHVVNALSVQTGDTTPIAATIATALAALAVICLILVLRRRRHRS
ncbi:MAG: LPXTG cell wall anchor domain-containing protein, partial [Lachnospiraceae bacterium]|nr:LPXTG cell wall anchor domain-containing protein [Lachnospiraceae bacterium]